MQAPAKAPDLLRVAARQWGEVSPASRVRRQSGGINKAVYKGTWGGAGSP